MNIFRVTDCCRVSAQHDRLDSMVVVADVHGLVPNRQYTQLHAHTPTWLGGMAITTCRTTSGSSSLRAFNRALKKALMASQVLPCSDSSHTFVVSPGSVTSLLKFLLCNSSRWKSCAHKLMLNLFEVLVRNTPTSASLFGKIFVSIELWRLQ